MSLRIATPEQLERARTPIDGDDFAEWVKQSRAVTPSSHRTEHQMCKSLSDGGVPA